MKIMSYPDTLNVEFMNNKNELKEIMESINDLIMLFIYGVLSLLGFIVANITISFLLAFAFYKFVYNRFK